jgi:NADH:ubiquinone oxidoreductase subunit E
MLETTACLSDGTEAYFKTVSRMITVRSASLITALRLTVLEVYCYAKFVRSWHPAQTVLAGLSC